MENREIKVGDYLFTEEHDGKVVEVTGEQVVCRCIGWERGYSLRLNKGFFDGLKLSVDEQKARVWEAA